MAATIDLVTKVSAKTWRYEWSGTGPFRVWEDGVLMNGDEGLAAGTTNATAREFENTDNFEPPIIEVFDSLDSGDPEQITNPPYAVLQWRGALANGFYLIEENVASVWTTRQRVREDGAGYYRFDSDVLVDVATHQFRISAIDDEGNTGATVPFEVFMVRNPDAPAISAAYSNPNLTISAR